MSLRPFLVFAPLAALFIGFMSAGAIVQPPPVRATNSITRFDTAAAIARLERILGDETPHPVDSEPQDAVRAHLLAEIEALGLAPEVRDAFTCVPLPSGQTITCARVRNIVFQVGPEEGSAILAAAHYDSVPAAPGAADDGLGMAVLLETARLLRDQQLTRRIIFLISDGEEPGLIGAYSFAHDDPLMQSVEALVNVEARGTRGPAVFFETNQPNADAIAAFSGAPRGLANSVMADVYALLPNSTDVSVLVRDGLDVINIALLDGLEDYHTPQDSLASLDPRSVQHAGDVALHALQHFAGRVDRGDAVEQVYTDLASFAFVSVPRIGAQMVLGLAALIAFAAFWISGSDNRWRSLAAPLLSLVAAGVLTFGVGYALTMVRGDTYAWAYPEPARAWCALAALLAIMFAHMFGRGALSPRQIEASGYFWFSLLGFGLSFLLPGISIFFVLAASVFALGVLVSLIWKPARTIGAAIAALLALIVWAPAIALTELGLDFEYPFAFALMFALVGLTWLGLIARMSDAQSRAPALALSGAASIAIAISAFVPMSTAARPLPLNVSYFLNATLGEARIYTGSTQRPLPAGFDGFSGELILPGDRVEAWARPVEVQPAPTPRLEAITTERVNGDRIVRARIIADGAGRVIVRIPRAAQPLRATLNGAAASFGEAGAGAEFVNILCNGRACDGADLEVVLSTAGDVATDWYVIGSTTGFMTPDLAGQIARRPVDRTPIQNGDGALVLTQVRP